MICAHLGEPKEIEILVKGYVFNAKSNLEPSKRKECVAGLTNPTACRQADDLYQEDKCIFQNRILCV
jgi:hypothetical protein